MYKFKKVFRKKPGTEEGKYYASVSSRGKVSISQLAKEAGNLTSVNQTDVKAVIDALMQVIPNNLNKGLRVELGELGTLTVNAKSEGKDTPEEVNAACIHSVKPRFLPGKALKNAIRDITFEPAE
nr:HU family DNA-binding protein [uncultured Carboxylicivirga sp.]